MLLRTNIAEPGGKDYRHIWGGDNTRMKDARERWGFAPLFLFASAWRTSWAELHELLNTKDLEFEPTTDGQFHFDS